MPCETTRDCIWQDANAAKSELETAEKSARIAANRCKAYMTQLNNLKTKVWSNCGKSTTAQKTLRYKKQFWVAKVQQAKWRERHREWKCPKCGRTPQKYFKVTPRTTWRKKKC